MDTEIQRNKYICKRRKTHWKNTGRNYNDDKSNYEYEWCFLFSIFQTFSNEVIQIYHQIELNKLKSHFLLVTDSYFQYLSCIRQDAKCLRYVISFNLQSPCGRSAFRLLPPYE